MDNLICVDLFTPIKQPWMAQYRLNKVAHPNGTYYTITAEFNSKNQIIRECRKRGIRFRWYEKRWARSDNYRDQFFKYTKGPYQCRYCRRKLARKYMVIDHIIPVAQTKKSPWARALLQIKGIQTVNDVRNLAPSCRKCNARKSDKMGLWVIRGWLGKYKVYWITQKIMLVTVIALFIWIFLNGGLNYVGRLY